jgi:hypothetical protein
VDGHDRHAGNGTLCIGNLTAQGRGRHLRMERQRGEKPERCKNEKLKCLFHRLLLKIIHLTAAKVAIFDKKNADYRKIVQKNRMSCPKENILSLSLCPACAGFLPSSRERG